MAINGFPSVKMPGNCLDCFEKAVELVSHEPPMFSEVGDGMACRRHRFARHESVLSAYPQSLPFLAMGAPRKDQKKIAGLTVMT